MESLLQDLRFAARTLLRPNVAVAAIVLTLALGIGATVAIFSVVNTVLLQPLPYDDPGQIYRIRTIDAQGMPLGPVMQAHIDLLNEQDGTVLAAAYGFAEEASIVSRAGLPFAISEYWASGELFRVFTFPLALGRGFEPADDDGVTVLGDAVWRELFDSDPDIVGSVVAVGGGQRTVVGVAQPDFELAPGTGIWTKFTPGGQASDILQMDAYARLRPGVTRDQLAAELDVLAARLDSWQDGRAVRFVPVLLLEDVVGDLSGTVVMLAGAVAILLLIACLNVAMLLFTRSASREREIALRGALGARPGRIVRQLFTETALLAVIGGALGFGLAVAAIRVSDAIGFAGLPRLPSVSVDRTALLFAVVCVAATALLVGLLPALKLARRDLTRFIGEGGRGMTDGAGRNRLFGTLVILETAMAVLLVIAAGLLIRNYVNLLSDDPGFDPDRLLAVELNVPGRVDFAAGENYLRVAGFYQELIGRIAALPGVESATAASHVPLMPPVAGAPFLESGETFDPGSSAPIRQTQATQVVPGYFTAMGVRPVAGRLFEASDRRGGAGVVLVNEAFARYVYGDGDAVGQRINLPGSPLWAPGGIAYPIGEMATGEFTIVGIVPDIPQTLLWEMPEPAAYFPVEQWTVRNMTIVIRSEVEDPGALIPTVRAVIAGMDPSIPPVFDIYADVLSAAVARQRLGTALLAAFGLASLVLTAVGVYGLMSYSVAQRFSEIAVRAALGARSGQLGRMVVTRTLRLTVAGLALGLLGAWAARTVIASELHEIGALDPLVIVAVSVVILALAILAAYIPAHRAATVDPARALRTD